MAVATTRVRPVQERDFSERLRITDVVTERIVKALVDIGHITGYRKATKAEEFLGIDFWFDYPNGETNVPVQFKLRWKFKYHDFPVVYSQPCWGFNDERTTVGRDFKGITEHNTKYYYVAVKDETKNFAWVNRSLCSNLEPHLLRLEKEWTEVRGMLAFFAKRFFTANGVGKWLQEGTRDKCVFETEDHCQVWWKKNNSERSPKFNFYVPEDKRDDQIMLPKNFVEKYLADIPEKDR